MARPKGAKSDPNRERLPFKTADITRAIRGVVNMGLEVARIDINPRTGKIEITPVASKTTEAA